MLRSLNDIEGYLLSASDGEIGRVTNFLLDDERWVVRYLVAETGTFFGGRRVLISPSFFGVADWSSQRFHVALTVDKIRQSPSIDSDQPVSRQHERAYYGYYGYPYYLPPVSSRNAAEGADGSLADDVHLRSAKAVRGYHIQGSDAAIGHVADFIVDDQTWQVRYLVIDTSNWWFGKKVLVAPHWASSVSWENRNVYVDLTREAIKNSPEWNSDAPINREFETLLYDYYGRPSYWDAGSNPMTGPMPDHVGAQHAVR